MNCQHYYKEKFDHGQFTTRFFECISCKEVRTLSIRDKEFFFMEKEPREAWLKVLKARK